MSVVTNTNIKPNTITMDVIRDCSPTRPKLTKVSERHPKLLLEQINQLRKSNELFDVVLTVGNSKIRAHKIILSASSPYFRAMFTTNLAERDLTEITIKDIDENAMEMLVEFCYTSKITVDDKTVQTVLPAACLLQIQEVQDYCSEFLRSQLDPSNCLGIRAFADTHSCKELLKIADKYLQNNFAEVVLSDEFLLLPVNQLLEIISSDELNVKSEENVYKAVMNWVKYDLDERKTYLGQLMANIRLPLLDTRFLVVQVSNDPLIRSLSVHDTLIRDLIDEAKDYQLLPQDRSMNQSQRTKPRKPFIIAELLFAVGGWCSGDAISSVEMFDPLSSNNEWKIVASMSKRRCGVGVGVLQQNIFAVGGHDGVSYLNSVERYCPILNKWYSDVAPTSNCRTSVGVCCLDGYLYAVGGQDGVSCLAVVEKYDSTCNRWTRVASMSSRRLGVSCVVLGGFLYAIGGSDGNSPLNTVERYDPKSNRWTAMAPMITKRKHLGCAVFNDHIYAVGGRDDLAELNSAERYNPQTNQWHAIVPMKSRRSGVGLAVVNGSLMAIGGFDGSTYLKTVEIFDAERNVWKTSSSMIYRRLGGGVAVIKIQRELLFSKSPIENTEATSNANAPQLNNSNFNVSVVNANSMPQQASPSQNTNTWSFILSPPLNHLNITPPVNNLSTSQNASISPSSSATRISQPASFSSSSTTLSSQEPMSNASSSIHSDAFGNLTLAAPNSLDQQQYNQNSRPSFSTNQAAAALAADDNSNNDNNSPTNISSSLKLVDI